MITLPAVTWMPLARAHAERADAMTAGYRERRATRTPHAIEDFLYDYYGTRPSVLRRWHPGVDTGLAVHSAGAAPPDQAGWRWYTTDPDGVVSLDAAAFMKERGETVRFVHSLLTATASRPAFAGCFGLHEWAMVYRQPERRHALPLRLGQAGTDAVVEQHPIRCTHFDAFRFFTPEAVGLNRLQPTRATQVDLDQPGCLHAAMDCHKWAGKLGPAVPGALALDCFALAARHPAARHARLALRPDVLRPVSGRDRDPRGQGGVRGRAARVRPPGRRAARPADPRLRRTPHPHPGTPETTAP